MGATQNDFGNAGWLLRQTKFDADAESGNATLYALANGAIGVRGGLDELRGNAHSMLADAFVRRPLDYHERFIGYAAYSDIRFAAPSPTLMDISIDGVSHLFDPLDIIAFDRNLDLKTGKLSRATSWRLAMGRVLEVAVERLVPFDGGSICMSKIKLTLKGAACELQVGFPLEDIIWRGATQDDDPRLNVDKGVSRSGGAADGMAAIFTPVHGNEAPEVAMAQHIAFSKNGAGATASQAGNKISVNLDDNGSLEIERIVAFGIGSGASEKANSVLVSAIDAGLEKIRAEHQKVLTAFWHQADIGIDGDAELAGAIRFNLFHLFQSASRDADHNMAAKGLTGEGYEGHYFWDAEAFIAPVLTFTAPELARQIIEYRISKLDNARRNAASLGHKQGALYPWRTISGDECSAHYPTGAAQYHINAAIAFAVEQFGVVTGQSGMMDRAAEMIFETARIWLEIGHFSARHDGAFGIYGVTGPDEYNALVNNDFYTNFMAKRHLAFAAKLARKMIVENADDFNRLAEKINLAGDEVEVWQLAADQMLLPCDVETGVHPQDDGFLDKPDFPFADLPKEEFPLLLHHHPLLLFRHRICKQGDVVQALAMAGHDIPRAQKQRDFEFYEPLTTHDSTLSGTAFAIVAAEIGQDANALKFHRETAFVDLYNLHANSDHGGHMAAMAGSWLVLVQGWGGMRVIDGALHFRSVCPADWNEYSFRIHWRGSLIEAGINGHRTCYRLIDGIPVEIYDHGRPVMLGSKDVVVDRPTIKGVIFDLDGVLTDTAEAHYHAWKRLCDEEGLPFDRALNEQLKGVDRAGSIAIILEAAGAQRSPPEINQMMDRKNGYYRAAIAAFSPDDLFSGARQLLTACLHAGLRTGLASASRNAMDVVRALGIENLFDVIMDAGTVSRGKPDPEIFLKTAKTMGLSPAECIGVEDARAGIAAINAAGMRAIGIGDAGALDQAERVFENIGNLRVGDLTGSSVPG